MKSNRFFKNIFSFSLMLGALALTVGCNVTTGIFSQIVNERALFNGNLNDKASPTFMVEDDHYFYVVMNRVYRAKKELIYPEGYAESFVEDGKPITTKDENRSILKWESLDLNVKSFFPNSTEHSISCRTATVFNGNLYASFSDDALTFERNDQFDNYSKILMLNEEGNAWNEVKFVFPAVDAPSLALTDFNKINPDIDRVFSYKEDFSIYLDEEGKMKSNLNVDERNAYEIALTYDMGQRRRSEVIQFFQVGDTPESKELYALFSDTFLRKSDISSSLEYARNPLFRLFKITGFKTGTPILTPVVLQNDRRATNASLISEKEIMLAIIEEMKATQCNFGIARYRVLTNKNKGTKLNVLLPAKEGDREFFKFYPNPQSTKSESYKQNKRTYYQDSFYSSFIRHTVDQKTPKNKDYLFNKDGLFRILDAATETPKLEDYTAKLPEGLKVVGDKENFLPPDHVYPDPDNKDDKEDLHNEFEKYRYCDFFIYSPDGNNDLQRIEVALALSTKDRVNKRFIVAGFEGSVNDVTSQNWKIQTVNTYNLKETTHAGRIEVAPTQFTYFKVPQLTLIEGKDKNEIRAVNSLLMATNNGFYHAVPNPGKGNAPATFDGPKLDLAGEGFVPYEKNIMSISLSSSYITGFYPTSAKVKIGDKNYETPILFAFTAGNGLWVNYNKFWNRE